MFKNIKLIHINGLKNIGYMCVIFSELFLYEIIATCDAIFQIGYV